MKKVLVVDDTKNIRHLLSTCLELEKFEVFTAGDGKQALELILEQDFDLIFLDIKLPEYSGTEVLRKIREQQINTPVVVMTAFATVKNAVECTKLGAVAYLQKPFTAEKVRNILKEIPWLDEDDLSKVSFHLNTAKGFISTGKLDEAYHHLKQALAITPDCGEIYALIADIYNAQGLIDEANRFKSIAAQFGIVNRSEK